MLKKSSENKAKTIASLIISGSPASFIAATRPGFQKQMPVISPNPMIELLPTPDVPSSESRNLYTKKNPVTENRDDDRSFV